MNENYQHNYQVSMNKKLELIRFKNAELKEKSDGLLRFQAI